MTNDHRERAFEAAIEDYLLTPGGYAMATPAYFDCKFRFALISAAVTGQIDVRHYRTEVPA